MGRAERGAIQDAGERISTAVRFLGCGDDLALSGAAAVEPQAGFSSAVRGRREEAASTMQPMGRP